MKDSQIFVLCSIVLMVAWLFLYSAFQVSGQVSAIMLTVAFSLFFVDLWMISRPHRTH